MFRSIASDQIEVWRDQFQRDGYLQRFQPPRVEESVNSQMQSAPAMMSPTQLAPIGI